MASAAKLPIRHQLRNDAMESSAILDELQSQFASPGYRPPLLPAVALEVHQLSQQREVDVKALVHTIERDPTLAADTLRRAQSSAFTTRVPPQSLSDAALRLGTNGVHDLVWEVALNGRIFRGKGPIQDAMEAVRVHSLVIAHLSRGLAAHTSLYEDSAFLVGLLHDVGLACALLILGETKNRTFDIDLMGGPLVEIHAEAGETVARLWNLPDDLRWAISAHHRGQFQNMPHPLASITILAEVMADELGHTFLLGEEPVDFPGPAAIRVASDALNLSRPELSKLAERLKPNIERALG